MTGRSGATSVAGGVVVVSGPGGVGKGTVVAALAARRPELHVSVSATTRPPRPGERDGVHYHFLDDATFDRLVAEDRFLEWAQFSGRRYGTPWSSVDEALAEGRTVVLEIDVQGAMQVRQRSATAVLMFLPPPSPEALRERLRARGSDDPEQVARRMEIAEWELAQADVFDHLIVNDEVGRAVAAIGHTGRAATMSPNGRRTRRRARGERQPRAGRDSASRPSTSCSKVDSKYTLVHVAAKRAREINAYYHQLGEGLGQYVRPLVDHVDSNKPLSIALEEIAEGKVVVSYHPREEELAGSPAIEGEAAILDDGMDDIDVEATDA